MHTGKTRRALFHLAGTNARGRPFTLRSWRFRASRHRSFPVHQRRGGGLTAATASVVIAAATGQGGGLTLFPFYFPFLFLTYIFCPKRRENLVFSPTTFLSYNKSRFFNLYI